MATKSWSARSRWDPRAHFFITRECVDTRLTGLSERLEILSVVARTSLRTGFEAHVQRGLLPFIGRLAELQLLDRVLQEVRGGRPRVVAISAPAGVGKTRLAEEFLRRAPSSGCSISRGYCETDLSAEPLQPFLQMLRSRFQVAPGTMASEAAEAVESGLADIDGALLAHRFEVMQALSIPSEVTAPRAGRKYAPEVTIAALRDVFAALARGRPQIVFIDDWQWADDATRQVVHAIRGLINLPILLLTATRPVDVHDVQPDTLAFDVGRQRIGRGGVEPAAP